MKSGTRVNVTLGNGNELTGEVVKVFKNGKARVTLEDGKTEVYDLTHIRERKPGRKSLAQSLTPAELKTEVKDLIAELRGAKDQEDKKRIRRALRRRGHTGGLGE